ncbi:precorrin-8X methylmutase [Thiovibrio sp. JS02]
MTGSIKEIHPLEIEAESFRIIKEELGPTKMDPWTFAVVQRVIHASGDFAFAENLRFHPRAIEAGLAAIRAGRNVLVDVNMGAVGVSGALLAKWGGRVLCGVSDPEVARLARERGQTRSEVAMEQALGENVGIVAIGNAPTALLKVMALAAENPSLRPDLIVGVPVGFVNAAESKELLAGQDYPFITSLGRKGGSPVAAAIVNALLRLAGA